MDSWTHAFYMLALLACMIAGVEAGRLIGRGLIRRHGKDSLSSFGTVEGATLALFGLIVALSFSGAVGRFETRRQLLISHINAVGTAWLRLDTLPQQDQPPARQLMREYVDLLLAATKAGGDTPELAEVLRRLDETQGGLWGLAIAGTSSQSESDLQARLLLLPALNEMFDLSTSRLAMGRIRMPGLVMFALFAMSVLSAISVGSSMARSERRSPLHEFGFIFVVTLSILVLLDIEASRAGFVRIDATDRLLVDLRASMDAAGAGAVVPEDWADGGDPATRPGQGE